MLEFINWYSGLAPEGETALIVRQKPILKEGEQQFRKDGAVKCSWPAFLPKRWKDGQAWYGNTGSFIIDRFLDGKPSASAANVEYVLCMVLDDIGTKAKAPTLLPTWKMETSEGSFQWGYVFSEQPTKGDFSAAIISIAAAGYTDPGAINAVRNWRLPGSINIKPGRGNFASKLVEWNPTVEYTLDEICAALDVVPEAADTAQHRSVALIDDGKDEVAQWLSAQGLVLERPNASGWMGVVCPNAAEHSDGNPMGRYNPTHRAYSCLHAHCCDWDSERFMQWVATSGGPAVQSGTREELITEAMSGVMDKLIAIREAEGSRFTMESDAAAVVAMVDSKELSRVEKSKWFERFAYIQRENSFFDLEKRVEVSRLSFDAIYRAVPCNSMHGKHPKIAASVAYDEKRQAAGGRVLDSVTYAAGSGALVTRNGELYGNRWRDARPDSSLYAGADVSMWLDLWERLVPEKFEREHIFNVLAYKLQHPEAKINHAILIAGGHGIGKDTALAPFFWAIGGHEKTNISIVKGDDLAGRWGYPLESEVIYTNELRQTEAKDRRALENHLKPIIAAPPDMLMVEHKGMHPYYIPNRLLVIAGSNERAAIALPTEDRRWFVVWSDAAKLGVHESLAIWDWYKNGGGFLAISAWLMSRDVKAFNPGAAPPMTDAKLAMISAARSGPEEYLISKITNGEGDFASGVIASPFFGILDRLAVGYGHGKLPQGALLHALREAGWTDYGLVKSRDFVAKRHIYAAPEFEGRSKSDLRRMVETAPPAIKVVK
jgi:hypothetical protein